METLLSVMEPLHNLQKITVKVCMCVMILTFLVAVVGVPSIEGADGLQLYVATNGNDQWSGRLSIPNEAKTDGPFASITRARDVIRELKAAGSFIGPATVKIRGGIYYIDKTIQFGSQDSGTKDAPVSYVAYSGEKPELVGGRRLTGFNPVESRMVSVSLSDVKDGKWYFRQLFVDGKRQIRARYPDYDPANPYRGGFLYTYRCNDCFSRTIGNIHNVGDWLEYTVSIPASGKYSFWMYYSAFNPTYAMSGRTTLTVDGGAPIQLMNLSNTASWSDFRWTIAANMNLTAGEHQIRWQNVNGGGINLIGYAFSDDPTWKPTGKEMIMAAEGKPVVAIQAEDFVSYNSKLMRITKGDFNPTKFYYKPGDFSLSSSTIQSQDAEIHIFPSGPSSCRAFKEIVSLVNVNESEHKVTVQGNEAVYGLGIGDRYFIENVFEKLDSPGEWYLNKNTGVLYYYPIQGFSEQSEVIAPIVGRIMEFIGNSTTPVSYLRVTGLTIRATDYSPDDGCAGYGVGNNGVLYFQHAVGCVIENCTFTNIGKYAVYISGGQNNRINGNDISDSAEGGVLLDNTSDNEVSDNHISNCGIVYKHIGGIVLTGSTANGNIISHNNIKDISRYGVSLKKPGSYNVIEFNRIQNTNTETYDTGGIEVTQHDKEFRSHSIIRNNIVGDTIGYSSDGKRPIFMSWGIYLDSYAGGYTVQDNIVYRNCRGGIMLQGGKDNIVQNNIFVDSSRNQVQIANFMNNSTGAVFEKNIVYYTDSDAYTFYTGTFEEQTVSIDKNLYFCPGVVTPKINSPSISSDEDWIKKGYDVHSLIADPLFVDKDHDDYTLKQGSPAFNLGFSQIDTSTVGPRPKVISIGAPQNIFVIENR